MGRFTKLHPITSFSFFALTFILILSVNNPVFSVLSLVCSFFCCLKVKGKETFRSLKIIAVLLVCVSVFNMLFSHYGTTVLFEFNSIEFTFESLFYGFNQGMVLSAVILWFSVFNIVIDSDKIIYILRFMPKTALVISIVLGFIPRFNKKFKDIREAQIALLGGKTDRDIKTKFKTAVSNFSALISYSLESSIITADSMNARGYNPKKAVYKKYRYSLIDIIVFIFIIAAGVYIIYQKSIHNIVFLFEPVIQLKALNVKVLTVFTVFELLPVIIDVWEDFAWRLSVAKN